MKINIWKVLHCVDVLLLFSYNKDGNVKIFHIGYAAAAAKTLQSCPTLCDPIDSCPRGSTVPEILQALKFISNAK